MTGMTPTTRHRLTLLAEVLLVLAILALLAAIWLPALIGPHPNAPPMQ